ncbi:nuclear transport factor 2 family protein [Burkholderiaceae bacterium FT117]|uniref:nuclear transport factor 2 family protein n=1 Tax=Zeimonas sediminis TaxID=2944268 RepID=UPI0023430519|nr:nuclear transport factor 2 family protein [Zeimonas sediminis]MCM5571542.1 nuclear transport factor 2 family protein [Zeimonas sediminis]
MDDKTVIAEIEAREARRSAALVSGDFDAIEDLIGDDLLYVHSSATEEDRKLYMERLRNGHYVYKGLTGIKREHRVLGDVVLVNGEIRIDVVVKGNPKQVNARYLQVWARRPKGWQMVSWQSTPVPA